MFLICGIKDSGFYLESQPCSRSSEIFPAFRDGRGGTSLLRNPLPPHFPLVKTCHTPPADARRLGSAVPAGATVQQETKFSGQSITRRL